MVVRHQIGKWSGNYLPIQRPKKGLEVELIVLRSEPLYLGYHWHAGKSEICSGENEGCPACSNLGTPRVTGWAIVANRVDPAWRAMVEFSAAVWHKIEALSAQESSAYGLFGVVIGVTANAIAKRPPIVRVTGSVVGYDLCAEELAFRRGLSQIHRLPQPTAYADIESWEKVCVELLNKRWQRVFAEGGAK